MGTLCSFDSLESSVGAKVGGKLRCEDERRVKESRSVWSQCNEDSPVS